ncbi:arginine decarboxylase, pyruvoyl-dependent [bacterium]|nr:arginine decarboxylase, pyruvoyl-dependent [bacterium]MBU1636880.1 arginine decarboxylase, pyruvoyl-dependent [bacterium]MBU1919378.1 arginine decarboxylase, pyruvoyl-dependent [bacterium]
MTLFGLPDKYFLVSGHSEGETLLNAFDNALLNAGIGNTNLIRLSSILPPAAALIQPPQIPAGSLVPVAYAFEWSDEPGLEIAAAVACGVPHDPALPGVIMEHHTFSSAEHCREICVGKVEAAFRHRGWTWKDIKTASASHVVQSAGAVFAGVVLWK